MGTKKFKFLIAALIAMVAATAYANGPWNRFFQDGKFPGQKLLEIYVWSAPTVATSTYMTSATAQPSPTPSVIAPLVITTFIQQPDVARNVTLTPGGTTAHVGPGTAVISGTNIYGDALSENLTVTSGSASALTGQHAFQTVSSVSIPTAIGAAVTWSVGVGSALGVTRCTKDAADYAWSSFGGAYETTRGTFASDPADVSLNTFNPHGTMNGATAVKLFYVQNYGCWPH